MLDRQTVLSAAVGLGLLAVDARASLAATPVAELLPQDTPIALLVETEQATWDALLRYELFNRIADFTGQPLTPGVLPFLPYGLDYEADVAPWVGDGVAIALLPIPSAATIAPEDRSYGLASLGDPEALTAFMAALTAAYDTGPEVGEYKGVPTFYWSPPIVPAPGDWDGDWDEPAGDAAPAPPLIPNPPLDLSRAFAAAISGFLPERSLTDLQIDPPVGTRGDTVYGLAMAVLGDHVVFAPESDTLKHWIEYQQRRGPVLTENADFVALRADAEAKGALGLLYGNVGELAKYAVDLPGEDVLPLPLPLPQPTLRERAQASALFSSVTFEALAYPRPEGLHLEARLNDGNFLVPLPRGTVDSDDETILSALPASTYSLGSGYDLAGLWADVSEALDTVDISRNLLDTARTFVAFTTGLDLDTDIFGWMDGEYTLFFFPSRSGLLNSFLPGVGVEAGVLLQTTNREAADNALTAIDDLVGPTIASSQQLSGTDVVSWSLDVSDSGRPESVLSHTWLMDDTLAITTGTGAMDRLVNPFAFESLTEHSTFLNATDPFPSDNYGYFYVNAAPTLAAIYNLLDLEPDNFFVQEVKSALGTVYSVSMSTSSTSEAIQFDALLGLALRQEP